jgi:hypothetical protein
MGLCATPPAPYIARVEKNSQVTFRQVQASSEDRVVEGGE